MKTCNDCGKNHNNGKCPKCGSRNATTWEDESVKEKKKTNMNNTILDLSNFQNTVYQTATVDFTPVANNTYFIGLPSPAASVLIIGYMYISIDYNLNNNVSIIFLSSILGAALI